MVIRSHHLTLGFGLAFEDLYQRAGLQRLDAAFLQHLSAADAVLEQRLAAARSSPEAISSKEHSQLLLDLAPYLEDFLAELFGITGELSALQAQHYELAPLYAVKRRFVQRRALVGVTPAQASAIDGPALAAELEGRFGQPFTERVFAAHLSVWLANEAAHAEDLRLAALYTAWAVLSPEGIRQHRHGILFKTPHKLDMNRLVPVESLHAGAWTELRLPSEQHTQRTGFALTDPGMNLTAALDQATYCIKCHAQAKDSCSTGLKEKSGEFKKNALGVTLAGCPLEEKISEMNVLKERGNPIGALAVVTVDNPMAAGTGHRICNDCMKSCVYQKQDPVDIPQIETRTLKDVLELPWGFEIYGLLTRWNPLRLERWLPAAPTGYKVLVVGLGPAGFTLAHHLMQDGHTVAAIDGLKIEPLPEHFSGLDAPGNRVPFFPIRDIHSLYESLDQRVMAGFGGVAEYGITVRWDKNFLKILRLLLERRAEFRMFGGVRFGGACMIEDAFHMGFDHIALCAGAGRPTVVPMKNGLARGVRQASDFLMALQLTGAAKADSLANLQVRMPIVVIGGGLTAIDTATEALAYYPVQVEKFLARYTALVNERGVNAVRADWSPAEHAIADEFLAHARALQTEREEAARENRPARLLELLNSWGGVTIAYRRRLIDSPSYTLNHEEVARALEQGVRFIEKVAPEAVEIDAHGHAAALRLIRCVFDEADKKATDQAPITLPGKTILVAAGTQPNTVLGREDPEHVVFDGRYFRAIDDDGQPVTPEKNPKPAAARVLMSLAPDGRAVSFFGDLHPSYAGNVVKAMASAKQGCAVITRRLLRRPPLEPEPADLLEKLNRELRAVVHEVVRLTPTIVEVVVRAPLAARAFQPGQFYRLQNYETLSARVDGTTLAMEGLALTGASVDRASGLVSLIVLEVGGSSDLCTLLKPGEPVILMGPTGKATETPSGETVLLAGGGLGNAVLFSIGQALRARGSRVIYFAGYKKIEDRYKVEEIEKAADLIVWCCDEAPGFAPGRPGDISFIGNIVQGMVAYAAGHLGSAAIPLSDVDRFIVIGSHPMMEAVGRARHGVLAPFLKPEHRAIASLNSPMQCMMKEICAQCLQLLKDPLTGEESVIFACFNQDQSLDQVDFANLRQRLQQNDVQEKLTRQWIDRCLRQVGVRS